MTPTDIEKLKELAKELRIIATYDDHERGCEGRCYTCSCEYDGKKDKLAESGADGLDSLIAALEAAQGDNTGLAIKLRDAARKLLHEMTRAAKAESALSAKDAEIERLKTKGCVDGLPCERITAFSRGDNEIINRERTRAEAAEADLKEARSALILIEPVVNAMPRDALGTVEQHDGGWFVRDEWLDRVRALLSKQGE